MVYPRASPCQMADAYTAAASAAILNRLIAPPETLVAQSVPGDREYAHQELTALYLSWLNAIPAPVLNRPTPQGLAGRWRHASEWAVAADEAGLCGASV